MAYFYGWNNEQIENLSIGDFNAYFIATNVIESSNQLTSIQANSFVNLKKDRQKKIITDLKSVRRKYIQRELNTKSSAEIANELARQIRNGK